MSYFDRAAWKYARRSAGALWAPLRRLEAEAVLGPLRLEQAQSLLDVGCGAGFYLQQAWLRNPNLKLFGCDSSPAMVKAARAEQWSVTEANFHTFIPPQSVDRIVCAGMLEFVTDDEAEIFFRLARSWLSPNGQLALLIPGTGPLGMAYALHHWAIRNPVRLRSKSNYQKLAERAGFHLAREHAVWGFSRALAFSISPAPPIY